MNAQKILISTLIFTLLSCSVPTQASAGFLDWFRTETTGEVSAYTGGNSGLTFDAIHSFIQSGKTPVEPYLAMSDVAVFETTSHAIRTVAGRASRTIIVQASAYTSSVYETDSTPFTTANGTYARDGIVASNFLPFGTKIKIPSVFGNKIFVVEDRMNSRFKNNIDIWFSDRDAALDFGRRNIKIEIL